MKDYGTYFYTAGGANVTVTTSACSFIGLVADGSAGGTTITVKDGSVTVFIFPVGATSGATISPSKPIAFSSGISVTCSGTGSYVVFYGDK